MPVLIPNFAIYVQQRTSIPILAGVVDGYPRENHVLSLASTDNPVESGATITDNVVRKPNKLKLEGGVSDIIAAPGLSFGPDRASVAWGEIIALMEDKTLVDAVTALHVYRNMIFSKVEAPVDVLTGRSLRFTVELKEILVATTSDAMFAESDVDPQGPAAGRSGQVDRGDVNSAPRRNASAGLRI